MRFLISLFIAAFMLATPAVAAAPPSAKFKAEDITIIYQWYEQHPTKADLTGLSPNVRRQLGRGAKLPMDVLARDLPAELTDALGPQVKGYKRVIVGTDILLIEKESGKISDVIRRVLN